MTRVAPYLLLLLALVAGFFFAAKVQAAEPQSAAEMLPSSTIAYVEVTRPKELLALVLDHPLREKVEQLDEYKAALASDEYRQFRFGQAYVETLLETDWRSAVETLAEGGIYLAYDSTTEGAAVFVRSGDEDFLAKTKETFLKLARGDAQNKGKEDPIKEHEYRGVKVYAVEGGGYATLGPWLVLTNKADFGKRIIDAWLDGNPSSLAASENFLAARKAVDGEPCAWAYADLAAVRASGEAEKAFSGKADDPGAELLIGGILANLAQTPYVTASFYLTPQQARVKVAVPHNAAWIGEAREYYFGPEGQGRAPALLEVGETIASVSVYRDFSGMWLRAGDLFDEAMLDKLAQAESGLSTLFSGKDFGEDILGALAPQVQFVVTRQDFSQAETVPSLKLPAFAGVAHLREPETMQRELKRTFQSLIGFFNVVGAMNGQPPLDLGQEQVGEALLVTATFAPEADEQGSTNAKIHFNFSPTMAFAQDRMILASTIDLARQIAAQPVEENPAAGEAVTNVQTNLHAAALAKTLADNKEHLIAQNMLEKGHDKEAAEKEINVLMTIVDLFQNASLKLQTTADTLSMEAEVNLKQN